MIHILVFYTLKATCIDSGDGYCDDVTNVPSCDFDGGDCCGNSVNTDFCAVCACHGLFLLINQKI